MNAEIIKVCSGKIVEDENSLTVEQFCETCRIKSDFLFDLVEEGILEPEGEEKSSWRFSYSCVETVRIVIRMQRDLRVNLPGAALALQLLEQLKSPSRRPLKTDF